MRPYGCIGIRQARGPRGGTGPWYVVGIVMRPQGRGWGCHGFIWRDSPALSFACVRPYGWGGPFIRPTHRFGRHRVAVLWPRVPCARADGLRCGPAGGGPRRTAPGRVTSSALRGRPHRPMDEAERPRNADGASSGVVVSVRMPRVRRGGRIAMRPYEARGRVLAVARRRGNTDSCGYCHCDYG